LNFNGAGALKTRLIALLAILASSPALAIDHWAETAHILTGVEILSVDHDAILVSKESQPKVEACGLIFVSESGQVRVEAEDKDRKQLDVTQRTTSEDEPRQWIIHATGRVWVRIELIDFAAQKWDVERFDYLIEGTAPPDDDDDDPLPPEPNDEVPNEYKVGLVAYNAAPNEPQIAAAIADSFRKAGEFLYGRPSLKFVTSSNGRDDKNPDRSVIAWLDQQRNAFTSAKKWDIWAERVKQALVNSQIEREYKKDDWYAAFNEVAAALEMVK
jgi:hypothetical protein